jgi:hypothetical protein
LFNLIKHKSIFLSIKNDINKHTALAAPADDGILICAAPRPPRQSYGYQIEIKNFFSYFI